MSSSSTRWLFYPLLAGAAAVSLPAAAPAIGAQFFQETNNRIEDLFRHRNAPPKPPGPRESPFRIGEAPLASSLDLIGGRPGASPAELATSDETLLRQAAGGLTFGGLLQIGDRQVLVINKASYKVGGILTVRLQGTPVYLRIVSITSNTVTLGLNEARLTLHF
jgi:hypothetical protein